MSGQLEPNQYRCENCNGVFEKGKTDEEATAEFKRVFGKQREKEDALVCDDCYNKIMAWLTSSN